jgi:hypothetical protein
VDDPPVAGRSKKWQRAKDRQYEVPAWEPLLELAPEDIDDFMWMGEIELTDGGRMQMYKHYWTRRYLHLDLGGRAFVYVEPDRYEEVDAEWLLPHVFAYRESRASIVRRNEWIDGENIGWARSATKHRVSRERSLFVVRHAGICFSEGEEWEYESPRVVFLGTDEEGERLEVIAATPENGSLVILHAMPMRERYGRKYVEAVSWRV